jgi:hypothetical protein
MSNDSSGLSDEVHAEINPTGPGPDNGPQPEPIGDRPADGASTAAWVDYCVALGADRTFLTEETGHFDGGGYARESKFGRGDLIALADRLGG